MYVCIYIYIYTYCATEVYELRCTLCMCWFAVIKQCVCCSVACRGACQCAHLHVPTSAVLFLLSINPSL